MTGLIIENLISVDDTGIPKAPKINQIIDKMFFYYTQEIHLKIKRNIYRNVELYIILLIQEVLQSNKDLMIQKL